MRTAHRVTAVTMLSALTVLAVLTGLTACTQEHRSQPSPGRPPASPGSARLVRADGCDDLVARATAARDAGADPLAADSVAGDPGAGASDSAEGSADAGRAFGPSAPVTTAAPAPAERRSAAATTTDGPASAKAASGTVVAGTNVQEEGVDEGDLVKTDGHVLVSAIDGVLRVTVLDDSPVVDGSLPLRPAAADTGPLEPVQLLLRGREAVVVASDAGGPHPLGDAVRPGRQQSPVPAPSTAPPTVPTGPRTELLRVDLTDPTDPKVVERTAVDGQLVATRMVGDRIRVVLRSGVWAIPAYAGAEGDATTALRATDLMPRRIDGAGDAIPIGGCRDVLTLADDTATSADRTVTTSSAADPTRVTVLTVGRDLRDLAPVSVDGPVQTVYASTGALFLTTPASDGHGSLTVVHRFALDRDGPAAYTGSGFAPGTLLDQYSLSERDGALRLVTTTDGSASGGGTAGSGASVGETAGSGASGNGASGVATTRAPAEPVPASAGRLTVLRPDAGGTLVEVGHLDDLGVGERVRSVRFVDDLAYVVTFRTTDPLFAVDLSDPAAPRLLGELHLPGFSEYLHPVAPGRLLGIGTDADEHTGATRGFRATLFDVADPTHPRALDSFALTGGRSAVGDDPHAFTWDPVDHLAVVPVERGWGGCPSGVMCAVEGPALDTSGGIASLAISVDGDHLQVRGTLVHARDGVPVPIRRAVVVDRTLWTVSSAGLGRTAVEDPTGVDLLRY